MILIQQNYRLNTLGLGLAGIEIYDILRDDYDIQLEFGDIGNTLAYISLGDTQKNIERLVSALVDIKRIYKKESTGMLDHEYISPDVVMTPQDAFYAYQDFIPMRLAQDKICVEFVMLYPPGIPILAPGERITKEIIDYIVYAVDKGCFLIGTEEREERYIEVLMEEK